MRPTIVLSNSLSDHRELVSRLRKAGSFAEGEILDRLERGSCAFRVDLSGDVLAEFEEGEVAELTKDLGEFGSVLLEYGEVSCVRDLLREVIPGLSGFLDTNFGEVLAYELVLERFERNPGWDWRASGR
ncbi:hypothetical protein [Streptomyces lasiicapitis]|uniref:hypothetical protein n=1 Tax=Streptomyces lasiicapitis TaxID=1923961 RepID=UPI003661EBE9